MAAIVRKLASGTAYLTSHDVREDSGQILDALGKEECKWTTLGNGFKAFVTNGGEPYVHASPWWLESAYYVCEDGHTVLNMS